MEKALEEIIHTQVKYKQRNTDVHITVMEKDGHPVFQCLVDGKFIIDLVMNDAGCWESLDHSHPKLSQAIGDIIEKKTM